MSEDGAEEQNKTQTKWILIDKFYINVSELFIFESINLLLRDVMFTHSLGCLLCLRTLFKKYLNGSWYVRFSLFM